MIMKKLLVAMALLTGSLASMATDYLGTLAVVVDGNMAQPTQNRIVLDKQENGNYELSLKNFILIEGDVSMPIGNIVLADIEAKERQGKMVLDTLLAIKIGAGDIEGIDMWMGPMITAQEPVPVALKAVVSGNILTADITVPLVGQNVNVVFDSREFQLPNSGFEDFHTAKAGSATSQEPNNWHSFMSCTGSLSGMVSSVPHTFVSDDVRPGSDGSKSVLVKSATIFGIVANGTLTTGQLNAGGWTAEDTKNNAFIDLNNEARDENGAPFYTILNTQPDSISVWVKFKQGEAVPEDPYATMSAVIIDGSYYQEPADKDYSDIIVGQANCKTIESTGEWQKITVPFEYADKTKSPKGILVTFSTNAKAGAGTGNDELFLDDVELVYSAYLNDLAVNGVTLPGFASDKYDYEYFVDGQMPTVDKLIGMTSCKVAGNEARSFVSARGDNAIVILVLSADLRSSRTYTIKFSKGAAGVESIANNDNAGKAVYTLGGQKVNTIKKGGVYITRYANGKTVKAVGK